MTRAHKIGRYIDKLLGSATLIGTGYVWATHGILIAFGLWVGVLVVALAIIGALRMSEGEH